MFCCKKWKIIDHDDGDNKNWKEFDQSANDFINEDDESFSSNATIFSSSVFLACICCVYPPRTKVIPGFEGDLYVRGKCKDDIYRHKRYQYAMSSYEEKSFNPSIIACAKNEVDVIRVVEYAIKQNIAVSIRTGKWNMHSYN